MTLHVNLSICPLGNVICILSGLVHQIINSSVIEASKAFQPGF